MCRNLQILLTGKLQEGTFFLFKGVLSHAILQDLHKDTTIQGQALDSVFEGHCFQKVQGRYLAWKMNTSDVSGVCDDRFFNSTDLKVLTAGEK